MKKRNILLSVLGFAALATLASCGGKENPTKKENTTSGIKISTTEPSITSTSTSTSTSKTPTTNLWADQQLVDRYDFADAVRDLDGHPQELGYILADVTYSINGSEESVWEFNYDKDKNAWVSENETANDYSFIFNYDILSRVGNPFSEMSFYINELAIFPYGVKEVGDGSTATFVWDEEGNIVLFESTGWYFADSATFEIEYYLPKK